MKTKRKLIKAKEIFNVLLPNKHTVKQSGIGKNPQHTQFACQGSFSGQTTTPTTSPAHQNKRKL